MKEKKEGKKDEKIQGEAIVPLDYLVLDYQKSKYDAIPLAAEWSKILRRKEENRHLTPSEILDLAMRDVLSGRITWKDAYKTPSSDSETTNPTNNSGSEKNNN